jgi:hypothetical protein
MEFHIVEIDYTNCSVIKQLYYSINLNVYFSLAGGVPLRAELALLELTRILRIIMSAVLIHLCI